MKRFCQECGAKKVKEFTGKYDPLTGKKSFRLVCSVNPCDHDGHDGIWQKGFLKIFIGQLQCSRCKKKYSYDGLFG